MQPLDSTAVAEAVAERLGGGAALVAVSGGRDSMCLWAMLRMHGVRHAVAHYDYGLRGDDSAADRDLVLETGRRHGVGVHVRVDPGFDGEAPGLQERARRARGEFFAGLLAEHGYRLVVYAHHADDQLEAVLAGFVRGGGPRALAGMRTWRPPVLRPLLACRGSDLDDFAERHGVAYRDDASNATDRYLRNRIRHHVVPALLGVRPGAQAAALRSACDVRSSLAFADGTFAQWLSAVRCPTDGRRLDRARVASTPGLAFALHRLLAPLSPSRAQLQAARDLVGREVPPPGGGVPRRRSVPVGRACAWVVSPRWVWLEDARPVPPGQTAYPPGEAPRGVVALRGRPGAPVACDTPPADRPASATLEMRLGARDRVVWRTARRDDRLASGEGRRTRVRSVLAQAHLPPISRGRATVLTVNEQVVWVVGVRQARPLPASNSPDAARYRFEWVADRGLDPVLAMPPQAPPE